MLRQVIQRSTTGAASIVRRIELIVRRAARLCVVILLVGCAFASTEQQSDLRVYRNGYVEVNAHGAEGYGK